MDENEKHELWLTALPSWTVVGINVRLRAISRELKGKMFEAERKLRMEERAYLKMVTRFAPPKLSRSENKAQWQAENKAQWQAENARKRVHGWPRQWALVASMAAYVARERERGPVDPQRLSSAEAWLKRERELISEGAEATGEMRALVEKELAWLRRRIKTWLRTGNYLAYVSSPVYNRHGL